MADIVNDDFTDLTAEENSGEEAEAKQKPARAPRQPRPAQPEAETAKGGKRKKKRGRLLKIILIAILVVLIAGFVFEEVYLNYLGTRDMLIDAIVKLDPDFRSREAGLDEWEAELESLQNELDARERSVVTREGQNDRRKADLDIREQALVNREQWVDPLYKRVMSEEEIADMESLSRTYSMMPPESAAQILMELEQLEDVAAILYFMTERNSSAILAVMEPDFAAEITVILLYS